MNTRTRLSVLAAVCVLALGAAVLYFLQQQRSAEAQALAPANVATTASSTDLLTAPRIVFRSTALGDSYGRLAVVALADPAGARAILGSSCERVYATAADGVCVTANRGLVASYGIQMLDAGLQPVGAATELVGLPSRARISPDGSLLSTTTFVTGHSYAESSFSTSTIVRTVDGAVIGDLETFTTTVDGQELTAVDRNYWGVTFVDDDAFYATASSGGVTWLVKGSLSARTMTALHTDVECPSLSPDGTRVAFKTRQGNPAPGEWQVGVIDLRSGAETILPGSRSVDDQVEWLDNERLLYALSREGSEATTSDVWVVSADGSSQPEILVPQASSPAVVRN